jgi:hypothetical protein
MSKRNKTATLARQRLKISGQWIPHPVALLRVFRELSLTARRILDTLEIEHCRHGGRENGKLPCPYRSCEIFGLTSGSRISRAFRELKAAGLIEIIRPGRRSYADVRTPSLYRLTYLPSFEAGRWIEPTHEWKKTKSQGQNEPRHAVQIDPDYPKKPGSDRTAPSRVSQGQIEPHYLDLGEEGGGSAADLSGLTVSPSAYPQEGAGLSAPSPQFSDDQLPNTTAPSSGRLH